MQRVTCTRGLFLEPLTAPESHLNPAVLSRAWAQFEQSDGHQTQTCSNPIREVTQPPSISCLPYICFEKFSIKRNIYNSIIRQCCPLNRMLLLLHYKGWSWMVANKYSIVKPSGLKQHLWCLHLLTRPRSRGILSDIPSEGLMSPHRTGGITPVMRTGAIGPQWAYNIQQNILQNLNSSLNFNGAKVWLSLQIPSETLLVDQRGWPSPQTLASVEDTAAPRLNKSAVMGTVGAAGWQSWEKLTCQSKRDK